MKVQKEVKVELSESDVKDILVNWYMGHISSAPGNLTTDNVRKDEFGDYTIEYTET